MRTCLWDDFEVYFVLVHSEYVDDIFFMILSCEHGCSLSSPQGREVASELSAAQVRARATLHWDDFRGLLHLKLQAWALWFLTSRRISCR